jgi:NAD+ kinase
MACVGFFVHHARADAQRLAEETAAWLTAEGHEARFPDETGDAVDDLDLAVSLGGDGTMLRTVDCVAGDDVPVLGVNLGTLGYLTQAEPEHLRQALDRFLAGEHVIEQRMRMAVEVEAAECGGTFPALNEAVVGKVPAGQVVRLAVTVDGEPFTTYHADGVILATPTGSTAYAWSAGGPIVAPRHEAMLLVPVAPHMLFDRSLVLPADSCIRLEVADDRPADLSVDGRSLGLLRPGDAVVCTRAPSPARLVTFEARSFLGILKAKFGLPGTA